MTELRPYQQKAVDEIRSLMRAGKKKILLHMSTGSGKTVCFTHILEGILKNKRKAIMVVRGKQLVEQASQRLFRERIPHGVLQANHWNRNQNAPIQLCSIDTLIARNLRPEADLIIVDEAHMATTGKYKEFLESYPHAYIVAVTATPYTKTSLTHIADAVVHPITMQELIDQGHLVPARHFAPSTPDLTGVRIIRDEYEAEELEKRMDVMTGDLVGHWQRLSEQRPTLCFAVSISHSESIVARFNEAGIKSEHIEAGHTFEERAAAIERLRTGETKIISNVGIFGTGVDIPFLSCILMARPTKSYNLYVQQAGRGTRPDINKKDFIILDHAGNTLNHGFLTDEPEVFLEGMPKGNRAASTKICLGCYAAISIGTKICPYCGYDMPVEKKTPDELGGTLKEMTELPIDAEVKLFIKRTKEIVKRKGYKRGFTYYEVKKKYGDEIAAKFFPPRHVPTWLSRKS